MSVRRSLGPSLLPMLGGILDDQLPSCYVPSGAFIVVNSWVIFNIVESLDPSVSIGRVVTENNNRELLIHTLTYVRM